MTISAGAGSARKSQQLDQWLSEQLSERVSACGNKLFSMVHQHTSSQNRAGATHNGVYSATQAVPIRYGRLPVLACMAILLLSSHSCLRTCIMASTTIKSVTPRILPRLAARASIQHEPTGYIVVGCLVQGNVCKWAAAAAAARATTSAT
jgi:hypothetical protein